MGVEGAGGGLAAGISVGNRSWWRSNQKTRQPSLMGFGFWWCSRRPLAPSPTVQCGDDGWNVVFDADQFDQVAQLVKPCRRRQITEAERERLADRGRQARFLGGRHGCEAPETALESPQTVPGV